MTGLQLDGDRIKFVEGLADFISSGKTRRELEDIAKDVVLSELMEKDWCDVLDCADFYNFQGELTSCHPVLQ